MQQTLFGNDLIKSISFNQTEIISDIMNLYCKGSIECDVTYSTGMFYQALPDPKLKFDLTPQAAGVREADARNLPVKSFTIKSLMFDPPFCASWNVKTSEYKMAKRFTNIRGIKNLRKMYADCITEFARVLKRNGVLIVKCQDTVYAGRQYFNHIYIHDEALKHGFVAVDLFVLLSRQRINSNQKQKHSRKYHCFFWVFKKTKA